jgi:hypothetical protein
VKEQSQLAGRIEVSADVPLHQEEQAKKAFRDTGADEATELLGALRRARILTGIAKENIDPVLNRYERASPFANSASVSASSLGAQTKGEWLVCSDRTAWQGEFATIMRCLAIGLARSSRQWI